MGVDDYNIVLKGIHSGIECDSKRDSKRWNDLFQGRLIKTLGVLFSVLLKTRDVSYPH